MVQRGYGTSIFVLFAHRASAAVRNFNKYIGTGIKGRAAHWPLSIAIAKLLVMERAFEFPEVQMAPRPGIALALGGGFARGFAHLGVLQVLEQNHIPISHIAGTSVGSVFGAAYASGAPLARIIATSRTIRFRDIARWSVSRLGLASNHRLADLIERVFESKEFEDMKIPLAVVATDLASGDPVVFRQGPLVEAIRASCAFPGLFEPIQIGTRCLADGVLVAPVPTQAARQLGGAIVVGVSVGVHDGKRDAPKNMFQVVARAVSAAQKHQLDTWERHADLVIRPDVNSLAWDDFAKANQAIEAGAAAARLALPRIQKLLSLAEHSATVLGNAALQQTWLAEALR
jgi:NTE family protein